MQPIEFSRLVHAQLRLFRDDAAEVAAFANGMRGGHTMSLGPLELSHEVFAQNGPIAASPAQLSHALLCALFGAWPPDAPRPDGRPTRRRSAVSVRESTWEAWLHATMSANEVKSVSSC